MIAKKWVISVAVFMFSLVAGVVFGQQHLSRPSQASSNGGTVKVLDKANGVNKTYHHAKVSTIYQYNGNLHPSGNLVIITKSGQRIKPSNNAQVTYSKGALNSSANVRDN